MQMSLVIVGSGAVLPWSVVAAFIGASGGTPEALSFMASATTAPPSPPAGCASAALCAASADQPHSTRSALAALARALAPGGAVYVYDAFRDAGRQESLAKELTLAGYTGTAVQATPSGVVLVRATKPAFELGAKAGLKKKATPASAPSAAAWRVAAGDGDELVDDEELLTEDDKRPAAPPTESDCNVGAGKKACKNCSCGRADAEAARDTKVALTQDMLDNPVESACGSCGLGDAFRCASCPYRGVPAFTAGKKIMLGADLLTADV
ncbi:hypothetical protein FOA52_011291 [Chlamydomonas sp. UWO 241]|nr:hypothetical protein FOA52_011291 [Chlamydomonas sp. UWO 241]